ncbi:MAG: division/cell wall cluster transcriptional repressor MraZ [Alphaproteobacteria bacterium]|nr:division/cell wall cluster transcriptional repressor MraZ [Alphaproteobacteria bacterium]
MARRFAGECTGDEVAVFLSTFANKVDRKGRVSVPAPFRAVLDRQASTGIILYPSFKHPCIEGSGDERIQEIVDSIDALDAFSDEAENLQTILADARQLTIDSDGRIVMPPELLSYVGLSDTATFVGLGKSFQVWEPSAFEAHRDRNRVRAREQGATLRIVARDRDGGS